MKPFTFRLETLLRVRRTEEQVKQRKVIEAELEVKAAQEHVDHLVQEEAAAQLALREEQSGHFNILELKALQEYLQRVQSRLVGAQDELMRKANALGACRRELQEAVKERKSIEKLREKQYAQWKLETGRQEAKILDEMGTLRHGGNHSEY